MIITFEVQCEPKYVFQGYRVDLSRTLLGDGLAPMQIEPAELVLVPTFYAGDYDGRELLTAVYKLGQEVYCDTAQKVDKIHVGRFTFLELCAHIENAYRRGRGMGGLRTGDGTLTLHMMGDVQVVMTPGPDHFIQAVPVSSWMLSGRTITNYLKTSPRAVARALHSVPPPRPL